MIRARTVVCGLEVDGVCLVAGPGLVGQRTGQGEHFTDGRRREEPRESGKPLVAELSLACSDQVPVLRAGRVVDRVIVQVDDIVVPGRLLPGGCGHGAGSLVFADQVLYRAADLRMSAVLDEGNAG